MRFDFIRLKDKTETIRVEHDGGTLYTEPIFYVELVRHEPEPKKQQMQLAAFAAIYPNTTVWNASRFPMEIREDDLRDAEIIASYDTDTPDTELEKEMKYRAELAYGGSGKSWISQFTE